MAKNKTTETEHSVEEYLLNIKDEKRRTDCKVIIDLMAEGSGLKPKMWGTAIVGFGSYHYKYESDREGDAPLAAMASRSNAIVLYLAAEPDKRETFLAKLGKHKTSGGCIYIQKLEDLHTGTLKKMTKASIEYYRKKYPASK